MVKASDAGKTCLPADWDGHAAVPGNLPFRMPNAQPASSELCTSARSRKGETFWHAADAQVVELSVQLRCDVGGCSVQCHCGTIGDETQEQAESAVDNRHKQQAGACTEKALWLTGSRKTTPLQRICIT